MMHVVRTESVQAEVGVHLLESLIGTSKPRPIYEMFITELVTQGELTTAERDSFEKYRREFLDVFRHRGITVYAEAELVPNGAGYGRTVTIFRIMAPLVKIPNGYYDGVQYGHLLWLKPFIDNGSWESFASRQIKATKSVRNPGSSRDDVKASIELSQPSFESVELLR